MIDTFIHCNLFIVIMYSKYNECISTNLCIGKVSTYFDRGSIVAMGNGRGVAS